MSLLNQKWELKNTNQEFNIIAKLLENRGITNAEKADWFFKGGAEKLHDPFQFKGMDLAVERIKQAIDQKEKIMIFGDYDVDGITATSILYQFLKKVEANVHATLPNRETDGYGLQSYFIEQFKKEEVDLLITVDCGTSNVKEIQLANDLQIDVVVTDHHSLPENLPEAVAIINPHQKDCPYPNKEICGSSIAYKLAQALMQKYWNTPELQTYLKHQLGIVALGVVADCMALKDENRILVKEGLKIINQGILPTVNALIEVSGLENKEITSTALGFQIGPRINACGRMSSPKIAFDLFNGQLEKALELNQLNTERQTLTRQYFQEAQEEIETLDPLPEIIVVHRPHWRPGLLGLIASRLVEKFNRPSIVLQEQKEKLVASMRSIPTFNLTETLRKEVTPLCTAFGGHAAAGGLTLKKENLDQFKTIVKKIGQETLSDSHLNKNIQIDAELSANELNHKIHQKIKLLEPFGVSNPEPKLLIKNIQINTLKVIGKNKDHLKFQFRHQQSYIDGIAFRFGEHLDKIDEAGTYDVACHLDVNEWNGRKKLQLKVVDMRLNCNH